MISVYCYFIFLSVVDKITARCRMNFQKRSLDESFKSDTKIDLFVDGFSRISESVFASRIGFSFPFVDVMPRSGSIAMHHRILRAS